MRKIDITTTQNVTIEYELATVTERSLSTGLDLLIIYFGSFILYSFLTIFTGKGAFNYLYISVPGSFLYHLLMETLNHGQTLGKKVLKIRVVKINGERPGFFDFMMRTCFRLIDITTTFGTLALITVSSTVKGQRMGDVFADTTVVRIVNINRFTLDRILAMEKLKSYTPKYPEITKFNEEEMLLIKDTVDRYSKFPDIYLENITSLVEKIEEQLNITAPKDKIYFLNTLIKDYVSLTR